MNRIRCFLLEETDQAVAYRRIYVGSQGQKCDKHWLGYCNAEVRLGQVKRDELPASMAESIALALLEKPGARDGWPTACDGCGRPFPESATTQEGEYRLFRRSDTGELVTLIDARRLPGAMWFCPWLEDFGFEGPDGKHLCVVTPGGEWLIDSRASNCTLPQDQQHRCWVRHGTAPDITVDKAGLTCAAGAGSIQQGTFHGFLRNGYLEPC